MLGNCQFCKDSAPCNHTTTAAASINNHIIIIMIIIIIIIIPIKVKVKVNFTLEQSTKAQRGSRRIALLFLQPRG